MLPLVVRPEAEADLVEARNWYARQRAGLGDQFIDAIDELLEQVRENPQSHAPSLKNVRRAKVGRFPYVVYYRILDDRTEVWQCCTAVATRASGNGERSREPTGLCSVVLSA